MSIQQVGVVGAGTMGNGIVQACTVDGIHGNSAAEAMHPMTKTLADGTPLDGSSNKHTPSIAKDQFPPVNAFWSVTMYDGKDQLLVKNRSAAT